jgi:hypothetical protein
MPGDPVHVFVDNPSQGGQAGQPSIPDAPLPIPLPTPSGLAGIFKTIGGFLTGGGAAAGAAGGDGLTEAVSSSVKFLATGGDVDPGKGYVVGDGGEPEFFSPKVSGTITPMSKMGGGDHVYNIDARGAALGVENRIARSIDAAHSSAVSTSVRANHERQSRTPQRKS